MPDKIYCAIDLKSFYSSVECRELGKDPLTTNLVVADITRTEKTICLAVSPSLKAYGIPGRARLFEVSEKVKLINAERLAKAPGHKFTKKSSDATELAQHPEYELDFIIAKPRMQKYLDYSKKIYQAYLNYVSPEDIFAYSVDEVFCDISSYLKLRNYTPREFATTMIHDVYTQTGITATAGIGTNLFLAKVAMDVIAKHAEPDHCGVRIVELNEQSFRKQLWKHQPITDFWRIGPGTARKLHSHQMRTLGDVARCSLTNEDLLFQLFGVNAEFLIDHAWGVEPTEISDVKNYHPSEHSLSNGQVLSRPYKHSEARTIVKEMAEELSLNLTSKGYETDLLVLDLTYDVENLKTKKVQETKTDHYRRAIPKPAHGTWRLENFSNTTTELRQGFLALFDQISNPDFTIRKVNLTAGNLLSENQPRFTQTSLFAKKPSKNQIHEKDLQHAVLKIRERYGPNAILRGTNFDEGATGRERHKQIGGHRA